MANAGKSVRRRTTASIRGTKIVDVYIRYIRRKIDVAGEKLLLHTVRGVGYSISAE